MGNTFQLKSRASGKSVQTCADLIKRSFLRLQGIDKDKNDKFVLSVAYSPDGQRIAAGAMDGSVAVFDVNQGRLLHMLEGHKMPVRSLAFSPGKRMGRAPREHDQSACTCASKSRLMFVSPNRRKVPADTRTEYTSDCL